jgi:hypothetical protein
MIHVDISHAEPIAMHVWYDTRSSLLFVEIDGVAQSIDFRQIPADDFESSSPVAGFGLGQHGAVVVCRHQDGAETWLPVDLWLPGGFTPAVVINKVVQRA